MRRFAGLGMAAVLGIAFAAACSSDSQPGAVNQVGGDAGAAGSRSGPIGAGAGGEGAGLAGSGGAAEGGGGAAGGEGGAPASTAPWILFDHVSGGSSASLRAVHADQIGKVDPVVLMPHDHRSLYVRSRSLDGQQLVVTADLADQTESAHLLRFVSGVPQQPIWLTEGMAASATNKVSWSSSGQTIGLARDKDFHLVEVDDQGHVTSTLLSTPGFDQFECQFKSEVDAVLVSRNSQTKAYKAELWHKAGSKWSSTVLSVPTDALTVRPFSAAGLVLYVVDDKNGLMTLWALSTEPSSKPIAVSASVAAVSWSISSDGKRIVMITTATLGGESTVSGGLTSDLKALGTAQDHIALDASSILGTSTQSMTWSSDSKYALLFQKGVTSPEAVIYEPGAKTEWNPTGVEGVSAFAWSPQVSALVVEARDSAAAPYTLRVLSTLTKTVANTLGGFSYKKDVLLGHFGDSGALLDAYGTDDPTAEALSWGIVDLRQGLGKSGFFTVPPASMGSAELAPASPELVYSEYDGNYLRGCEYVDLSGAQPAAPIDVDATSNWCTFVPAAP